MTTPATSLTVDRGRIGTGTKPGQRTMPPTVIGSSQ